MTNRLPPIASLLRPPAPSRPPWVALLRGAAETLHPPEEATMDVDEAQRTCQPWTVWVRGARLVVVYDQRTPDGLG